MNRLTALLIAIALWATIYLPGLGSTEMKGEEGRRVMPAVTMMEGGSWVVPEVGGKPFLRKPPLVQWCMVASMKVFGKNTWAARLPSALGVLALAAAMILCTRRWLIAEQSLMAAIILMAQVAMIEKCRLAEMEGVYVALSGLAILLWMSWWAEERSPWLVWTVPLIFNGLAILAKAPLHLLFFYAVVVATLIADRRQPWRPNRGEIVRKVLASLACAAVSIGVVMLVEKAGHGGLWGKFLGAIVALLSLVFVWRGPWIRRPATHAHIVGLLIMAGIVTAWAVPYFHEISAGTAGQVWKRQFVERVTGAEMDWAKWLLNIPNGLGNHLPWVLFVPLLWRGAAVQGLHPRAVGLLRGARWAVAGCFLVLLLIPGVLPRYVQPLAVPFSLLLAVAIWDPPQWVLNVWRKCAVALSIILFIGAFSAPFVVAEAVTRGAKAANPFLAGLGVLLVFVGALMLISLRKQVRESVHLAIWTGAIAAMVMLLYATAAVPWMHLKEDIRPFAERIDKAVADGVTLYAYSLEDYAPLLGTLFYLKETPVAYAPDPNHAPNGRQLYLVRGKDDRKFRNHFRVEGEPIASWLPEGEKSASVVVWAERVARGQ